MGPRLGKRGRRVGQVAAGHRQDPVPEPERRDGCQVLPRLTPPAFVSGDDKEHGWSWTQPREHVADEALVSGHVDEGNLVAHVEGRPGVSEVDGQSSLTLLRPAVGLDAGEGAHKSGLAVIDVSRGGDHVHGQPERPGRATALIATRTASSADSGIQRRSTTVRPRSRRARTHGSWPRSTAA